MVQALKARRTQAERRDETRRQILDATVACLIELGYARTSTLEVQKRAAVSRGALLHHFPSKAVLLVAAVRHLAELRGTELTARAAALEEDRQGSPQASADDPGGVRAEGAGGPRMKSTGGDRVDAVMDLLWESSTGPLFYVSMELRTAARTDPELREVLADEDRRLRRDILCVSRELFGEAIASKPGFDEALELSVNLMMGAGMNAVLHERHARTDALLSKWKRCFHGMLEDE